MTDRGTGTHTRWSDPARRFRARPASGDGRPAYTEKIPQRRDEESRPRSTRRAALRKEGIEGEGRAAVTEHGRRGRGWRGRSGYGSREAGAGAGRTGSAGQGGDEAARREDREMPSVSRCDGHRREEADDACSGRSLACSRNRKVVRNSTQNTNSFGEVGGSILRPRSSEADGKRRYEIEKRGSTSTAATPTPPPARREAHPIGKLSAPP